MRRMVMLAALVMMTGFLMLPTGCSKKEDNPVTPPPPCSINILSPAANASWLAGKTTTIRWDKAGASKTVRIELFKGADFDTVIAAAWNSVTNPPSYPWTVSSMGQSSDDDYALKITALEDTSCSATVGPLEILNTNNCAVSFPYTVKDTIPDLTAGEVFTIRWDATETTGKVTLELWDSVSANTPGKLVGVIAFDLDAEAGSYDWTVDSFNQGSYDFFRFRVFDAQLTGCNAFSVPFRMTDDVICTLDVLGIAQNTIFNPGQSATLTFSGTNNGGKVDLRLYAGAIEVEGGLIVSGYDLSQGPFVWTVEDFGWVDDNSRYKVRAIDSDDEYCFGDSERFTITR